MRIGIDFDNTLADYEKVFLRLGQTRRLLPDGFSGSKREIRDLILRGQHGERQWMALQSAAYGTEIRGAELAPGAASFLAECRAAKHDVFIISHKTRTAVAAPEGPDLRRAALGWMDENGFFSELGIARDRVFFEATRSAKCGRIGVIGCDIFVDDLAEVFADPDFPSLTDRFLLQPNGAPPPGPWRVFRSWRAIEEAIFGA